MALPPWLRTSALILANVLLPVAVLTFASGFFPYKPVLPGLATFSNDELSRQPLAIFDRVIFMVVDALRSDFVFGHDSGFTFTQSLIRNGSAIPFTAHASPPTVTMPRVKALTTGSVPSFLDLILNFAESDTSSSLAGQDTWLAQLRAQGKSLVFYGDDTWLKLFPAAPPALVQAGIEARAKKERNTEPSDDAQYAAEPFFARHDGTSSFFVSDFTQVDLNVSRHLPSELQPSLYSSAHHHQSHDAVEQERWSAMILHYLGLDHIGHKTGPTGPNMIPKQSEMDGIVRQIYTVMQTSASADADRHDRTLLVLAGDHGMNAGGNHGGSGPGETEPALVLISPRFAEIQSSERKIYDCPTSPKEGTEFHYYTKVQQSDLIPTLAGLMGFPVSRNSLGVGIQEVLQLVWNEQDLLTLLQHNARQILGIVEAAHGKASFHARVDDFVRTQTTTCDDQDEGEAELACLWALTTSSLPSTQPAALLHFLHTAQSTLSGVASSYNIPNMMAGILLTLLILLLTLLSIPNPTTLFTSNLFLTLTALLHALLMFASSYVEEEQTFWYWLFPPWITALLLIKLRPYTRDASTRRTLPTLVAAAATIVAVHRAAISWNQTGQKYAGAWDVVHGYFPTAPKLMWVLVLATYVYVGWELVRVGFGGLVGMEVGVGVAAVMVGAGVVFKLNFTQEDAPELVQGLAEGIRGWSAGWDLVWQAKLVFGLVAMATVVVSALSVASWRVMEKSGRTDLAGALPSLAERLHVLLTLFLITQTRAPNVPLFLGMELQRVALRYLIRSSTGRDDLQDENRIVPVAVTTLLLSHVYFFCMGGSNSISSIDLSNAYNGVADYNIVAVGVLLFASNWTGPIWWCSAAVLLLTTNPNSRNSALSKMLGSSRAWVENERSKLHADSLQSLVRLEKALSGPKIVARSSVWRRYIACMTGFLAVSLLGVMVACTALRTHLFIWTVFSPKYLYSMAWSIGWHGIINIGLGSLLSGLAGIS